MNMQKEFEQELVKTQLEVQEHTLKTIASDIHDNVGQILGITKLTLSSISTDGFSDKNAGKLNSAKEMLDNATDELRQMATLLHAENILAKGLAHAVEREISWLLKSERLQIQYFVEGKPVHQMPPQTSLIVYRMTQEILNNVIKHSEASEVVVKLRFHSAATEIFISDNGKGFSVERQKEESAGLGMRTLYHRAGIIGALLQLDSEEGKGTTAFLQIPHHKTTVHAGISH